jgi:integrase
MFHGLRHGAATLPLAVDVPDTVTMRSMGHADTRILARYQDVVSELQRDAASRMDQLLGSTEEGTVTRSVTETLLV